MRSMTGFGSAQGSGPGCRFSLVLRAVNHRYLDVTIRLKEPYRTSEPELRTLLQSQLVRGRIEVSIDISPLERRSPRVEVRRELLEALLAAVEGIEVRPPASAELRLGDLLRLPEVLSVEPAEETWSAADREALLEVSRQALASLIAAREREGETLAAALARGLAQLRSLVAALAERREQARRAVLESLRQRLAELIEIEGLDPGRLEQEAALLAERSDIQEELDRLAGHLDHFGEALLEAGPSGRRLDFLAQEIQRELNTVAAKGRDGELARLVVEARIVCEQLREQAQNVE